MTECINWTNLEAMAEQMFGPEWKRTENGALGYKSSGKALIDLNFKTSSYRNDRTTLIDDFKVAYIENPILALKWLFYARDIRGGMGERDTFRYIFSWIADNDVNLAKVLIPLVPEYGRWDDLWCLLYTPAKQVVIDKVEAQLREDVKAKVEGRPVSLLAKWMPSINATSNETKQYAKILCKGLKVSEKMYRKLLSTLRRTINIVETTMSEKRWAEINYEKVPSRASLNYANAFQRHDEIRYKEFIAKALRGETKMNASVLYPSDIVHKCLMDYPIWRYDALSIDDKYEALWKNLKNVEGLEDTIVVCDTSGSMGVTVSKSNMTAEEVARSLAIYFAERLHGEFKDKIIAFSCRPFLIDLSDRPTLYSKLAEIEEHCIVDNTNIKAVFDLVLQTAIKAKSTKIPKTILIISDMEFNQGTTNMPLMKEIEKEYNKAGYSLPKLVFWNVASRTNTIPLRQNDKGVILLSGYSPAVMDMVLSGELDPYKALVSVLNSSRYDAIDKAIGELANV